MFRSGFVAIIGRPNVGKSTLMNALVGFKATIVTDKPQTTRNRIRAVLNRDNSQIVFLDTPGVHRPQHKLGDYMLWAVQNSFQEVDALLMVVDGTSKPGGGDHFIARKLQCLDTPVFLVVNKSDLLRENQLANRLENYRQLLSFNETFAVSALEGKNLDHLVETLENYLPEGPRYFPPDMVTDQPESFIVSEIIREKIFGLTREEIPFSVAIEVEEIKKRAANHIVDIRAVIYVDKYSHKGIIIGKEGRLLKKAGSLARKELEALLGSQIYLDLWVKVKPKWKNNEAFLHQLGMQRD